MRLDDERPSENIEDRRGRGGFGFPGGRGGRGIQVPMGRGGMGLGTVVILLIMMLVFGINPLDMIGGGGGLSPQQQQQVPQQVPPSGTQTAPDEMSDFVARVLGTTERTWEKKFAEQGRRYEKPTLVMFSSFVQSACGMAQSAMGPFYCPLDKKVYIDLAFFRDMQTRLGATGDFAQAYVIAHEVGHHVQNLLGIAERVTQARMRLPQSEANDLSVRMELQADCLAGVWARDNAAILEQGDIEEGLNAASAIGDDRLQRQSQGYVVPDSFTHGSSAQRVAWLRQGIEQGTMAACDTFK